MPRTKLSKLINATKPITSLDFLRRLKWIDETPLVIEPYRAEIFRQAFDEFDENGRPKYSLILTGRGKKNFKSADLILAALYSLMFREAPQGSDVLILANDEGQAADDLGLAKKLVAVNPGLADEIEIRAKELVRRDGKGSIKILPARDVAGSHGKSACTIAYDELHGYRDYDLIEALSPDPTRDTLTWVASYQTIYAQPGIPLFDLFQAGKNGTDPKMLFSWYSGSFCTDPDFANLEPELRANPSMSSWKDGRAYLDAQKRRLPFAKFRRLHLNEPGAPTGAFLDQGKVLACVASGVRRIPWQRWNKYISGVDMSGGSLDNAVLAITHKDPDGRVILDCIEKQAGAVPFNPRDAVKKFAGIMSDFGCTTVYGDRFAGQTFRRDFEGYGKKYEVIRPDASTELLEKLEPLINAGEIQLLDDQTLIEELCTLVITRGGKVLAESGSHDDFAVALATAAYVAAGRERAHVHYSMVAVSLDGSGPDLPVRTVQSYETMKAEAKRLKDTLFRPSHKKYAIVEDPEPTPPSLQVDPIRFGDQCRRPMRRRPSPFPRPI
ncbi:MAG: hypothetical protein WAK55_09900 [Xanthobacteraceae bacterium]